MSTTLLKGVAQLPHRFRGDKQGYLMGNHKTFSGTEQAVHGGVSA